MCCSAPTVECKSETKILRVPGGRPAPLLRSRTLPAIVAPGLNILQAQIDARYNSKLTQNYIEVKIYVNFCMYTERLKNN